MAGPIPAQNRIVRHCRASDLVYDGNGVPTGVLESAFRARPSDTTGVSVIWADFFAGSDDHKLNCVRSVVTLVIKPSNRMAVVRVAAVLAATRNLATVVEDPCADLPPATNAAHALISPPDALGDKLARDAIASSIRQNEIVSYTLTP